MQITGGYNLVPLFFDSTITRMVNLIYQGGKAFMSKVIEAVYEDGVFKPLEKVKLPRHKRFRIFLDAGETPHKGKCSLAGIIDITKECSDTDLSVHHDKYLYGGATD